MTTAIVQAAFFNAEQEKLILDSFLNGASKAEAAVLMELARIRRLNPITRQIHFVKRWDAQKQREVWSAQVGIDGFRAIAERTGKYAGQDEPEFSYDAKGQIQSCRVRAYRSDWQRPAVGIAHFKEYAQTKKDGSLTQMWRDKPHVMIAKCAEALALRKAFPEDMSGLYTPEEMGAEVQGEKDVTPPGFEHVTLPADTTLEQAISDSAESAPQAAEQVKAVRAAKASSVERAKAAMREKLGADLKPSVTAYGQILEAAAAKGYNEAQTRGLIKSWTGKTNAKDLEPEDVRIFVDRLAQSPGREPGSDDEEAA